jgi:hypothetical protein
MEARRSTDVAAWIGELLLPQLDAGRYRVTLDVEGFEPGVGECEIGSAEAELQLALRPQASGSD